MTETVKVAGTYTVHVKEMVEVTEVPVAFSKSISVTTGLENPSNTTQLNLAQRGKAYISLTCFSFSWSRLISKFGSSEKQQQDQLRERERDKWGQNSWLKLWDLAIDQGEEKGAGNGSENPKNTNADLPFSLASLHSLYFKYSTCNLRKNPLTLIRFDTYAKGVVINVVRTTTTWITGVNRSMNSLGKYLWKVLILVLVHQWEVGAVNSTAPRKQMQYIHNQQ